uniref:Ovule protein n=1 Tax=Haemonchus placei TaxID=6290 RepID=A0A0N4W1P9_HAEPC
LRVDVLFQGLLLRIFSLKSFLCELFSSLLSRNLGLFRYGNRFSFPSKLILNKSESALLASPKTLYHPRSIRMKNLWKSNYFQETHLCIMAEQFQKEKR